MRGLLLVIIFMFMGCGSDSDSNDNRNNDPLTQLQGTWVFCDNQSDPPFGYEITFKGDEFVEFGGYFADLDCSTLTSTLYSGQGSIVVGDPVSTQSGDNAREIDVIFDSGDEFYNIYLIEDDRFYLGDRETGNGNSPQNRPTEIDFNFYLTKGAVNNSRPNPLPQKPTPNPDSTFDLQGRWVNCDNSVTPAVSEELIFENDSWYLYDGTYEDSNCSTNIDRQLIAQGTFSLGSPVATPSEVTAIEIDLLNTLNTIEWFYLIIYIDQNQLYIGDYTTGDGVSPDTRPTDINFDFYYTKSDVVNPNPSPNPNPNPNPTPITLADLQGLWLICANSIAPTPGIELVFENNTWVTYNMEFEDSNCLTSLSSQLAGQGAFSLGSSIITNSGVTATELNIVHGDGTEWFDLIYIDQNQLYLGDYNTGDGTSPDTRPTDIDFTIALTKMN